MNDSFIYTEAGRIAQAVSLFVAVLVVVDLAVTDLVAGDSVAGDSVHGRVGVESLRRADSRRGAVGLAFRVAALGMKDSGGGRPVIFGIVNLTEDSFSDGGRYLDPDAALDQARSLIAAGADVLDLGPASSHPDSKEVSTENERARLELVLPTLVAEGVKVSVDSWRTETQAYALAEGAAYLNDIRGFADDALYAELAASSCHLVVMHALGLSSRAVRKERSVAEVLRSIDEFFDERIATLEAAGIARERLILDPGMGFFLAANPEPSVAVLRGIGDLRRRFGQPVLISVSRKSFLGAMTGRDVAQRGPASLAAELYAVERGADLIRTHDPGQLRDALAVRAGLMQGDD